MKTLKILVTAISVILLSCDASTKGVKEYSHSHDGGVMHSHPPDQMDLLLLDTLEKQLIPATATSPEYIQLATNLEVIPSIKEAVKNVSVLTHEGIFGPLLFAEKTRAFFIELKPGMFLSEHPHPIESIVYTIEGKWVLCSEAKRQVMEEGSLFHFGSNMPTGWEAPFAEGALLLVVKTKEEGADYEPYMAGLKQMAQKLDNERKSGAAFYYNELESDHAAIQFARSVNPDFDQVLKNITY